MIRGIAGEINNYVGLLLYRGHIKISRYEKLLVTAR